MSPVAPALQVDSLPFRGSPKKSLGMIQTIRAKETQPSVQFIHSVMSDSLPAHGLQHTRLPCSSQSPGVCSNSCPLSQWCRPTISFSVVPFASCLQSFPASELICLSVFGTVLKMVILAFQCCASTKTTTAEWKQSTGRFPEPGQPCPQVK